MLPPVFVSIGAKRCYSDAGEKMGFANTEGVLGLYLQTARSRHRIAMCCRRTTGALVAAANQRWASEHGQDASSTAFIRCA